MMITHEEHMAHLKAHIAHMDAHSAHMKAYDRQENAYRGPELRRWLAKAEAEGNELAMRYLRDCLAEWEKEEAD